jgi:hypothetical protein
MIARNGIEMKESPQTDLVLNIHLLSRSWVLYTNPLASFDVKCSVAGAPSFPLYHSKGGISVEERARKDQHTSISGSHLIGEHPERHSPPPSADEAGQPEKKKKKRQQQGLDKEPGSNNQTKGPEPKVRPPRNTAPAKWMIYKDDDIKMYEKVRLMTRTMTKMNHRGNRAK